MTTTTTQPTRQRPAALGAAAPSENEPENEGAHPAVAPGPSSRRALWRVGLDAARGVAWALVGVAVLVALWELAAARSPGLPTPAAGLRAFVRLVSDPFYDNGPNDKGIGLQLAISLQRVFGGFALAALVGVPLGLLIGGSRRAWQAVNPIVQVLRPVSPLAWFPIWLTVLRDAGQASVFVIFVTALWPTVLNTATGAASVPRDHRNVARVFRFGRLAYVRHVLVPDALPSIVAGLRVSMGIAWMVIVAVEMLSGGSGIGFFVWDSYNASKLASVIAAIALIGLVGVVLDAGFVRLARRVALEEVEP